MRRAAARKLDARALSEAASGRHGGTDHIHLLGRIERSAGRRRPEILDKDYTITAEVDIPEGGAEGMIVTEGGRFRGHGLFLSKGVVGHRHIKVVFLYNVLDIKRTIWEGPKLSAGKHTIRVQLQARRARPQKRAAPACCRWTAG